MRKDGKLVIKLNKYFFLNLSIFIGSPVKPCVYPKIIDSL